MKKSKVEEVVPIEEVVDKSVVSSKEVDEVVNGNEKALVDQIERIKSISKEQELQMIEEEKQKAEAIKKANELKMQEMERVRQIEEQRALDAKKKTELLRAEEERQRLEAEQKKKEEEEKKARELANVQTTQVQNVPEIPKKEVENQPENTNQEKIEDKNTETLNMPPAKKGSSEKAETAKRIFLVVFFIAIFALLYFMDYVNDFISNIQARNTKEEVITTGKSVCELKKSTDKFDVSITATFQIINSKLTSLTYLTVTKGDEKEDKNELEELYNECITLKDEVSSLNVTVSCSSKKGEVSNKQIIDYEKIDKNKVTSAYTEAGGVYPEFNKGQNIDEIESKMTSSGYKCSRS